MTRDIMPLAAQGQAAVYPRPGVNAVDAAAEAAAAVPLRDQNDPPIFLLQANPNWQGGILPDGVKQRLPIGVTNQVLTVLSDGSVGWVNSQAGFANPMANLGDLITGGTGGLPTELLIGSAGQVLTVVAGVPQWANAVTGFVNPMTALGDLITGNGGGVAGRLGVGSAGQVLTVSGGVPAWQNPASGFSNPMTTAGDLIIENATPAPDRLPIGAAGQVLTVSGGLPSWQNSAAGFANPMTATGDLITGGAAGAAQRLAAGSAGQVLTISGGVPAWAANPTGFANPMTTTGDLILGGAGGAAGRLARGASNGQALQVLNGAVAWATMNGTPLGGPSGAHQVLWQQPDGTIVVLPLSTYSLSGDDSTWINTAFSNLPQIAGGSGQYGGTYNGPWTVGTVRLLAADYTITSGVLLPNNAGATINLLGHGPGTRLLVGASATAGITSHVTMGGPQAGVPAQQNMGTIAGMRIDGSSAAAGAAGIEIGGGWGRHIDVACVNFQGAGSMGAHFVSKSSSPSEWMEKCRVQLDLLQNTIGIVIENTSGNANSSSFEYNDWWLYIIQTNSSVNNGPGLLLRNGAYLSGGSLHMRGNMPTNSGPALSVQGNDGAGTNSAIYHEFLDITMETNASSNFPQSVNLGTNNNINNCTGLLSFQFGTWVGATIPTGNLLFGGIVFEQGSTNLQTANSRPQGWI